MALNSQKGMCFDPMVAHIESMIVGGVYPPGSRLPTLRKFCEEFALRLTSARRGMLFLEQKGLIEIRPGSGAYVTCRRVPVDASNRKIVRIAVFVPPGGLQDRYLAHALSGAQEEAEKADCRLLIQFLDDRDKNVEARIADAAAGCDAMLLLGCYDTAMRKIPHGIPITGLEMHHGYGGQLSTVTLDPVNAAELAAGYFRLRHIKEVLILDWPTPVHHFRGKVFADLWREQGGSCEQRVVCFDPAVFKDDSVGYLAVSGSMFDGFADAYRRKYAEELRARFTVLSLDGRALYVPAGNPADTLWLDWQEAGRVAFAECLRRLTHPGSPARRIYVNVFLREYDPAGSQYRYGQVLSGHCSGND